MRKLPTTAPYMYGLKITKIEYFIRLRLDPNAVKNRYLLDHFEERLEQRKKYEKEDITNDHDEQWSYSFPQAEEQHYDSVREYYGIRKLCERGPEPFEGAEDIELDE